MATLDDKLLGEKLHYYCSSSEDEGGAGDSGDEAGESGDERATAPEAGPAAEAPPAEAWTGSSTNTGPKGVIKDWQRYKQLEAEKRAAQSLEKMQIAKKLSMTCRSNLDDDKEKAEELRLEEELGMLEDDAVLREFIERRMRDMAAGGPERPQFGRLVALDTSEQFLDAVDQEHKEVTVIVHLYDERTLSCRTMNDCLTSVSRQQPLYKFCKLRAATAGVSKQFSESGVPALIVYKGGAVIGNFVRLEDELGDDFCPSDLENFLIEHGLLADRSCAPACIRDRDGDSDDSD